MSVLPYIEVSIRHFQKSRFHFSLLCLSPRQSPSAQVQDRTGDVSREVQQLRTEMVSGAVK